MLILTFLLSTSVKEQEKKPAPDLSTYIYDSRDLSSTNKSRAPTYAPAYKTAVPARGASVFIAHAEN